MFKRTAVVLLAVVAATGALRGQQAPRQSTPDSSGQAIFRTAIDYVEVDAFVVDAQNNPVRDLEAEDFAILEDGKPQTISAFSLVDIPIARAVRPRFADRPIEADVQTNDGGEGRVYMLVLDDLHTGPERTPRVKAAARRFIEERFGTNDIAAVVFTGRSEDAQDFTNNTRLLLRAIDRFQGQRLPSATISKLENARTGGDRDVQQRAFHARNALNTVRRLAEFMAGVHGRRKAMLLVGEGLEYDQFMAMSQPGPRESMVESMTALQAAAEKATAVATASSVMRATHDAIAAATRGNVSIYAIDPRALSTGSEELIGVAENHLSDGSPASKELLNEQRMARDSLRVLAENTGGFASVNSNDVNGAFDRIVAENSSYYLLGFYPTNDRRSGRFRKLEVRVKRPGLRVARSRNGYYEARGKRPTPTDVPARADAMPVAVAESLGSPLPVAGVPMKVFAAAYKGVAPHAAVALAIEVDVNAFDFVEENGTFNEEVTIVTTASDSRRKVFPGDRSIMDLTLTPDAYARVKASGIRVVGQVNLPPGRYQLRIAAGNRTGTAGSVLYDLDVPDFYKDPFTMSGVSLTSAGAAHGATLKAKDPLGDVLPGPPVAVREFTADDTIALFTEFYENVGRNAAAHTVDLLAELRGEDGTVVRESREERQSTQVQGGGGYGFATRLPLEGLSPGIYVLHVQGKSRANEQHVASRDILLTIK